MKLQGKESNLSRIPHFVQLIIQNSILQDSLHWIEIPTPAGHIPKNRLRKQAIQEQQMLLILIGKTSYC